MFHSFWTNLSSNKLSSRFVRLNNGQFRWKFKAFKEVFKMNRFFLRWFFHYFCSQKHGFRLTLTKFYFLYNAYNFRLNYQWWPKISVVYLKQVYKGSWSFGRTGAAGRAGRAGGVIWLAYWSGRLAVVLNLFALWFPLKVAKK